MYVHDVHERLDRLIAVIVNLTLWASEATNSYRVIVEASEIDTIVETEDGQILNARR